jgi:hypothetical protein
LLSSVILRSSLETYSLSYLQRFDITITHLLMKHRWLIHLISKKETDRYGKRNFLSLLRNDKNKDFSSNTEGANHCIDNDNPLEYRYATTNTTR